MTAKIPNITLNNSVTIPQVGFGVFQIPPEETAEAVSNALDAGYRHIDTAQMYGNEEGVAAGLAASGLKRSDVFVTSKINNGNHGYDNTMKSFDGSLQALGFDQLDLMLIHWPQPATGKYVETWKALEKVQAEGRVRAIGVSNFQVSHLERLMDETDVVPAVNQIELHPQFPQVELREFNAKHHIATEAWSPLAQGDILSSSTITGLASKYDKDPGQIVLRWHLQLGNIIIPKSVTPSRIKSNLNLFNFELADDDMESINELADGTRRGPNPDNMN